MISRFPDQLAEALELAKTVQIKKHSAPLRSVFISGLGGSGIGGNFVQEFTRDEIKLPVFVNKGYEIPRWINKHTLAICSSYSGNTEETVAVFEQLLTTGAKIVVVSSGGKLLDLAKKHGFDFVKVPGGWASPRACLGFSVVLQLAVLRGAKLISGKILQQLEAARKLVVKDSAAIQKQAEKLAGQLIGKTPVIYIGDKMEAVAVRWRQQINENAKMLCWHHVLPEMNHNELVGWKTAHPEIATVWLRNKTDFERTAIRTNIIQNIIRPLSGTTLEIFSKGKSEVEKAIYLTNLGDWTSLFLAEKQGVDPQEIEVIDFLKNELAKIG